MFVANYCSNQNMQDKAENAQKHKNNLLFIQRPKISPNFSNKWVT